MRKVLSFVLALFVSACLVNCSWAGASNDDAAASATAVSAVSTDLVTPAVAVDTSTTDEAGVMPVSAVSAETSSPWHGVIVRILTEFVLPILSTLALLVGIPWLLKKLKMEGNKEAEEILTSLVKKAINYAESLAQDGTKPASTSKKDAAVNFVLDRAKELGLAKLTTDYVAKLIEGQLARDKQVAKR